MQFVFHSPYTMHHEWIHTRAVSGGLTVIPEFDSGVRRNGTLLANQSYVQFRIDLIGVALKLKINASFKARYRLEHAKRMQRRASGDRHRIKIIRVTTNQTSFHDQKGSSLQGGRQGRRS